MSIAFRSDGSIAIHSEIGWIDPREILSCLNARREYDMHKFHSIAALCGDGLRPELRALFERLAIDPHSGLRIRHDGMIQAGPDPVPDVSDVVELRPKRVA
jgi:hypothetical protein